ncbi:hypothetical protein DL89DRAFT_265189 [Linderina pennispora]|uniref:VPS37 C-terminal domain-containing protein n=1 Tax=Linderina pennispora TaxID=61395 RepID=A0A1Y1WII7_9FUNG|nr:uncharacterized protein DL89DRAFT_265189 [Linderina pennispora]ORX73026.1 hypothetical protein DL89DRAFT_265189 [Linderina pennispora]
MPADSIQIIRELDAIIQSWISIHSQSVPLASTLGNLDEQIRTAAPDLLVSVLRTKSESTIAELRKTLRQYGHAIKQLDSLQRRLADEPVAGHGVRPADRQAAYTTEYLRRRALFDALTKDTVSVAGFVGQWAESKVDYAVEEEYLERLRLVRLARQWRSNQQEH